ncbi:MAG: hypothetical protein PF447_11085 [Spirochaetaceae bacterium]|jgi:hypothetical protein|nr:hypothetical protein [Spirochaetaceae bacterium]
MIFKDYLFKRIRKRIHSAKSIEQILQQIITIPSQEEIFSILLELKHEKLTYQYLKKCGDPQFRTLLLELIDTQNILEEIAQEDSSPRVRQQALSRLNNKKSILDILKLEQDGWIIVQGLDLGPMDRKSRLHLINHHQNHPAVDYYLQDTLDNQLLLMVARDLSNPQLRDRAFSRLSLEQLADEEKLALLRNCSEKHISAIIHHLDKAILAEIKKGGSAALIGEIDRHAQLNNETPLEVPLA